jgi:hypothetical protein
VQKTLDRSVEMPAAYYIENSGPFSSRKHSDVKAAKKLIKNRLENCVSRLHSSKSRILGGNDQNFSRISTEHVFNTDRLRSNVTATANDSYFLFNTEPEPNTLNLIKSSRSEMDTSKNCNFKNPTIAVEDLRKMFFKKSYQTPLITTDTWVPGSMSHQRKLNRLATEDNLQYTDRGSTTNAKDSKLDCHSHNANISGQIPANATHEKIKIKVRPDSKYRTSKIGGGTYTQVDTNGKAEKSLNYVPKWKTGEKYGEFLDSDRWTACNESISYYKSRPATASTRLEGRSLCDKSRDKIRGENTKVMLKKQELNFSTFFQNQKLLEAPSVGNFISNYTRYNPVGDHIFRNKDKRGWINEKGFYLS